MGSFKQWKTSPQTDDATVRANFIGIAPQVTGHIVELHVRDNQQVREGDLLFLIDPRPYEIAMEHARAMLALTRQEVDGLKNGAGTAMAGVSRAEAQLDASAAEISRREMDPVVAEAETVRLEAQFQRAEVFTLVDTRTWYVVANFRETQLRHIPSAPVDLYLQSQPGKHFRGTVVGLGWAVLPKSGTSVMGLPRVERALDWTRLAARFPVRIKVENPDDSFRLGASTVATVQGTARAGSQ